MFKLPQNCTHLTHQQSNAQNSPSEASTVCDSELPDVQAGFRKDSGTRDQIANICWIIEKAREFQKNIYFCFIDYAKAFDCVDHNKLWKILKEMRIPLYLPPEKTVWRSRSKLGLDMEQLTGFKLGKEYSNAVYCHPAYLIYMQSTSCEIQVG